MSMPHLLQYSFAGMPSAYTSICPFLVSMAGEISLARGISKWGSLPTCSLQNRTMSLGKDESAAF